MDCYKIKLNLRITRENIPYGYEMALHGYVSSIIGNEMYNQRGSNYVYTNIIGIKPDGDHYRVDETPYFLIRLSSKEQLAHFLSIFPSNPEIFDGVYVESISPCYDDEDTSIFSSSPASPIILSKKYDSKDHLSKNELIDSEKYLTNNVIRTASQFGYKLDDNFRIKILRQKRHTNYYYRGWMNKGRNLTVQIIGNKDTKDFVLSHGIGRCTGIGCGFLR
jgi:CRISPR-associated endoribonuclease Cas6